MTIPVWVKALDPLSQFGLMHALAQRPEIQLIDDPEAAAVALVAVDSLDSGAVHVLRAVRRRGCRRIVLIGSAIDDGALITAVDLGVSGVLRRTEATPDRIVHLVRAAAAGAGNLPTDLLARLLGQAPSVRRLPHSGLSDRETQVLRLVADGKDTQEIARELSYSERTVKNVLHGVTSRLQLRNRSHAVAYALRQGLI